VIITFQDERLRKLCNDSRALVRTYGPRQAEVLRRRLDQLQAANSLGVMRTLPGRCHELTADRAGQLSLDLVHPMRLLFEPAEDPPPAKEDGGLDWGRVEAVRIIGIEDTHD
jgi:plasmid maintenance system killer protein